MPDTPLVKKLVIKPYYHMLLLHAPESYRENLGTLAEGIQREMSTRAMPIWAHYNVRYK